MEIKRITLERSSGLDGGVFLNSALCAAVFSFLYASAGVRAGFLSAYMADHGVGSELIGFALAGATALNAVFGSSSGAIATKIGGSKVLFTSCALLATLSAIGLVWATSVLWIVVAYICTTSIASVLTSLLDVMANDIDGVSYPRVRAFGSAAFALATIGSGLAITSYGLSSVPPLLIAGWLASIVFVVFLPTKHSPPAVGNILKQIGMPLKHLAFRRLLAAGCLLNGSNAFLFGFGTIYWTASGLNATSVGIAWGAAIVAEIAFFTWGRSVYERYGASRVATLAGLCTVLGWALCAFTTWLPTLIVARLLLGVGFSAMQLTSMALITEGIAGDAKAAARTLYSSLTWSLPIAVYGIASGWLYEHIGGMGFMVSAVLSLLAIPMTLRLRMHQITP